MGFGDILWLFFIFSAIQPVLRQKMLEASRLRVLHRFERARGSRAIALVHRQETMSLLGFPLMRYIDVNDSEEVLRAIKLTGRDVPIDLIVHTPGGLVLAAGQIAHALKRHRAKVSVFVPHYAMSGGTLLAISADEIRMDEHAVLGPLDPQLGQYPAISVLSVLDAKPIADIDDETLILADLARKALTQVGDTVVDLLVGNDMPPEQAADISRALAGGQWTHDYPITVDEAQNLGLRVETGLPDDVYALMELYPQPGQRRPSVGYIPVPYRRAPANPASAPSAGRPGREGGA
jgi:ClpP class serine protease